MVCRVDTNHVDLAVRRNRSVGLGPAIPGDTSLDLVDQKTLRVKPRFGEARCEFGLGPLALLRMTGECSGVDREPLFVVNARARDGGRRVVDRNACARAECRV